MKIVLCIKNALLKQQKGNIGDVAKDFMQRAAAEQEFMMKLLAIEFDDNNQGQLIAY